MYQSPYASQRSGRGETQRKIVGEADQYLGQIRVDLAGG